MAACLQAARIQPLLISAATTVGSLRTTAPIPLLQIDTPQLELQHGLRNVNIEAALAADSLAANAQAHCRCIETHAVKADHL